METICQQEADQKEEQRSILIDKGVNKILKMFIGVERLRYLNMVYRKVGHLSAKIFIKGQLYGSLLTNPLVGVSFNLRI